MGYGAMTAAVKLRHPFRTLAPIYAEHNILTFPIRIADGEKKPRCLQLQQVRPRGGGRNSFLSLPMRLSLRAMHAATIKRQSGTTTLRMALFAPRVDRAGNACYAQGTVIGYRRHLGSDCRSCCA